MHAISLNSFFISVMCVCAVLDVLHDWTGMCVVGPKGSLAKEASQAGRLIQSRAWHLKLSSQVFHLCTLSLQVMRF